MVINIGVLGACMTRDVFNTNFNPNYKKFFKVNFSVGRTSLISMMSPPIDIDDDLLKILPETKENNFRFLNLTRDFKKVFLDDLINAEIDYLLFDNYFEVIFGILYLDNSIITNNFWDLKDTIFYQTLDKKEELFIYKNPQKFYQLYTKYCDNFFQFLKEKRPNLKVILCQHRAATHTLNNNGKLCYNRYKEYADLVNPYLSKLDNYILNNFNVLDIDLNKYNQYYADDNHHWGPGAAHYEENYYLDFLNLLIKTINTDLLKSNTSLSFNNIGYDFNDNLNKNKKGIKSRDNSIDIEEICLINNKFKRPFNFKFYEIQSSNTIKLVDNDGKCMLFVTVFGRLGNHCKESSDALLNNIEENNLELINSFILRTKNVNVDVIFYKNNEVYEHIYYFYKNNKSYKLSFVSPEEDYRTLTIAKEIIRSMEII